MKRLKRCIPPLRRRLRGRATATSRLVVLAGLAALAAVAARPAAAQNSAATGMPEIVGSADVSATLTATTGTIADADGLPAESAFNWQWVLVDGGSETDISGETAITYTVAAADLGKTIKVKASFTDDAGNNEGPLASAATPSVDPRPSLTASFHPPQQTVDEGSTARVTLRLVASKQPADTVSYRAVTPTVGAATATAGADYSAILPALQEAPVSAFMAQGDGTYVYERTFELATLRDAVPDSGETFYFDVVQLVVTANRHYNVSILGDANGALITINEPATGSPAVAGTLEVGQTLTASKGTIADVDGLPAESAFTWQWVRVDGGTETDIDGETGQSYTLVQADIGKTIKVKASFTDNAGNSEGPLISAPTLTVPDTVAPAFVSARANGASLAITFDEDLAAASPPNSAFTVKKTPAGGAETTVTLAAAPTIAGRTVTLTLSEALAHDDGDVKVSYAASGLGVGDRLADGAGNAVADFTDQPVSNDTGDTGDTVAPAFVSARANGASLVVTFDEDLAAASPPNSAFTVKKTPAGGAETTVTLAGTPSIAGRTVTLTLSEALAADDGDVKVSYAASGLGVGDRLADGAGNAVADFTDRPVSNETPSAPRTFVSAAANGASLVIVFDTELAPAAPPLDAFTVKKTPAGGTETTVTLAGRPSIDGRTVTLTLSEALAADDGDVKVSYAAPAPGTGDRLVDGEGNAVADFIDRPVSNETRPAPPRATPRAAPTAWTARFGRTVALQAIDAVAARLAAPRAAGLSGRVAGQGVAGAAPARIARPDPERATARFGGDARAANPRFLRSRTATGREVLGASSLALTGGTLERGSATLWGRGSATRFEGGDGQRGVDGDVVSAMLGADFASGKALGGLVLSHSRGTGGYRSGSDRNRAESTLTALFPYGRFALSDRVSLWGMAGYGAGRLEATPPGQSTLRPRLDFVMGAAGLHGVLSDGAAGGVLLEAKSDAMAVRTRTDAVSGSDGGLAATEGDVTRLRLALEGSRPFTLRRATVLTPSLALGARHDDGDAETGFGADIAAGVALTDTALGLSAELHARGLLTHEDAGAEEIGISGSLSFDPAPDSDRGLSLRIAQAVGGEASSGADALLARPTLADLGAGEAELGHRHRLEARLGYGFPVFNDRWTGTPELGLGLSDAGRDYRLGWRLSERPAAGHRFALGLEGTRSEAAGRAGHGLEFHLGWRYGAPRAGSPVLELRLEAGRHDAAHDDRGPEERIGFRATARH